MDIEIRQIKLTDLKPSKINARKMSHTDMERLTKNIKQDGKLTSTPLVYHDMRIVSGHHRVEAGIKAGVQEAHCMVITSDVSDQHLTALQLSHNSIAGVDDPDILKQMLEDLPPLEQEFSAVKLTDKEFPSIGPSIGGIPEVQVTIRFLPSEVDAFSDALEQVEKAAHDKLYQLEPSERVDDFIEAFFAVKRKEGKKGMLSKPATLLAMARLAKERIEQLSQKQD